MHFGIGEDIARMRLDAGVSIRVLSRATGIDPAHIRRIEAGVAHPSLVVLIALGRALGADLSLRYFAGAGLRIHDRFQAPMVEALLRALHRRWRPELEVPVSEPSRGVIDAVLHDRPPGPTLAVELQSDLRRIEQQIRWGHEKAEGLRARLAFHEEQAEGPKVSQLLVLRSTIRTRELARQYQETLQAAFPARTSDAFAALTTAEIEWPGSSIVWMQLHGTRAWLMQRPPPGVAVGR
jgi:transcriptional regulator with XRE-family HTH domain